MAIHPLPSPLPSNGVLEASKVGDEGHHIEVSLLHGYGQKHWECHKDNSENGAFFLRTCFNGLNALSGVGILSIPYALSEGGWISLVLLLLVALVFSYTGLLLQRCMSTNSLIRSYPDIGERAFGSKGRLITSLFLYSDLYLVAVEFLILEGDNLDKLLPNKSFDLGIVQVKGKTFFTIAAALVILPTTWLRNPRAMALVSATGVVASLVILVSVTWVAIFDDVGFLGKGTALFNLSGLPTTLGLYSFCYSGHAVFPTLYTSMEKKSQFSKVLYTCFMVCTVNYGSMAVVGYLMYGGSLKSQITLNLPKEKVASLIAVVMTLINPFAKYALMVSPITTTIEERFLMGDHKLATYLIRTLLVVSTIVVAISIPFFGCIMALMGSFLGVVVAILMPCLCYLKIFDLIRKPVFEKVAIFVISVVGILVAIPGTVTSVRRILQNL